MQVERRRVDRDRRRGNRVPAVFAVKNTIGSRVQLGQAEDIGPTGMTLRRPKDAPVLPLTALSLKFALPGVAEEIAVAGLVVSDASSGPFRRTGVRFTFIAPEDASLIDQYCSTGLDR
jgi:hypothetical protein